MPVAVIGAPGVPVCVGTAIMLSGVAVAAMVVGAIGGLVGVGASVSPAGDVDGVLPARLHANIGSTRSAAVNQNKRERMMNSPLVNSLKI